MNSNQIRTAFLNYFKEQGHTVVPSSSLVPDNDPTLLFTNAGMVPFKNVFLGTEKRDYTRAASSQRCIRAGGKHNDLENVGYTARHHTFFEMLGNFSFGDYFKKEALEFIWGFLTKVLKLPQDRLWVSVYKDDQETADLWVNHIGFDKNRISFCGEEDNFWTMGDTGPCGPCTEIFYDHGEDIFGGPPGSKDQDGDRFIEIWNIVFTQFDRSKDGVLTELPKPSVDTGMGLERLAAVLQGVHNNYETDLFQNILKTAADLAGMTDLANTSLRVIADHIRSGAFLIADGVMPSNEGRGYVLRRIIRRAVRHGNQLGMPAPFFYLLVQPLINTMGEAYPELKNSQEKIEKALKREEELFMQTLAQGIKLLEKEIQKLSGDTKIIPGDVVFKLYDTYGFPMDLTADYARENNLAIDEEGFNNCMAEQKNRSKQASKFSVDYSEQANIADAVAGLENKFLGYEQDKTQAKIIKILQNGKPVEKLAPGENGIIILDQTVFYGEAGGQVGDTGILFTSNGEFKVEDAQKTNHIILHYGINQSSRDISVGESVEAEIDIERRNKIRANHSATHLLHLALQAILGDHIEQKGSLVTSDKLRLDFSHEEAVSKEQLWQVEKLLNTYVRENQQSKTEIMTPDEAKSKGAMALFGEKYGDKVRVLTLGKSMELCGGTHVNYLGDIGLFKILSEGGIAAGIRRIEAVTGEAALEVWNDMVLKQQAQENIIQAKLREQEKQIKKLKLDLANAKSSDLVSQAKNIAGMNVLAINLEDADPKALRSMAEELRDKLKPAIIVLATASAENKVTVVAGVSKELTDKVKAGELVGYVAKQVGGKGGGRPDLAQAGGSEPAKLDAAIASVFDWVTETAEC